VANNNSLATPAIWYPDQSDLEWQEQVEFMMARAQATHDLLTGDVHPDTFLDLLNDHGFDIFELAESWELGDGDS
jgi:hypothetical protein